MTEYTPVPLKVEWEPVREGICLWFDEKPGQYDPISFHLGMGNVRELMYDMEEAVMTSRGYEKVANTPLIQVEDTWIVRVMGNDFRVASTLLEARSKYDGIWVCLQDNEGRELVWPSEDLVTAYRPIE